MLSGRRKTVAAAAGAGAGAVSARGFYEGWLVGVEHSSRTRCVDRADFSQLIKQHQQQVNMWFFFLRSCIHAAL